MTDNFEKKVAVDGPVVNAGELGSSTFSPGQALPAGPLGLGQRWTVAPEAGILPWECSRCWVSRHGIVPLLAVRSVPTFPCSTLPS